MYQYISSLINSLPSLIAHGGYFFIFLIVVFEGIPIFGAFLPGHVVIIAAGFLAKIGILSLPWVLVVSFVGAFLGDFISFYFGRKYGYPFIQRFGKYLFIKKDHIEKVRAVVDKHTGKTLILGKFSPITRPLAPLLVGASSVPVQTFTFYNLIGAAMWVGASVLLGYVFGASYHLVAQFFGKFLVVALIGTFLIIWGYRFVNLRFHVFKKYELFVLGLNLISLWALAKTIQDALSNHSFLANFDIYVNAFSAKNVTHVMSSAANIISLVGDTTVLLGIGIVIAIIFFLKKKWRRGSIMLFSVVSTSAAVVVLKDVFMRSRPSNALQHLTDPSFPSGHAAIAAAFFVALAYILAPKIQSWVKRELFIVGCVLIPIIIGVSRLVLNVHWASDVMAGWSLGVFLATSSILLIRYVGAIFIKRLDN